LRVLLKSNFLFNENSIILERRQIFVIYECKKKNLLCILTFWLFIMISYLFILSFRRVWHATFIVGFIICQLESLNELIVIACLLLPRSFLEDRLLCDHLKITHDICCHCSIKLNIVCHYLFQSNGKFHLSMFNQIFRTHFSRELSSIWTILTLNSSY